MITKEAIKQIVGTAMLFDEKKRFDSWHGDEAKEWIDMVAEAIWSAQQSDKPTTEPADWNGEGIA